MQKFRCGYCGLSKDFSVQGLAMHITLKHKDIVKFTTKQQEVIELLHRPMNANPIRCGQNNRNWQILKEGLL